MSDEANPQPVLIPAVGDRVALDYQAQYVDGDPHQEGLVVDVWENGDFNFEPPGGGYEAAWTVLASEQESGVVTVSLVLTGAELVSEHRAAQ